MSQPPTPQRVSSDDGGRIRPPPRRSRLTRRAKLPPENLVVVASTGDDAQEDGQINPSTPVRTVRNARRLRMTAAPPVPPCPVTGEPAVRLVQSIRSAFLASAWRYAFRVDVTATLRQRPFYHLWESPVGLYFFDPMIEGDHE